MSSHVKLRNNVRKRKRDSLWEKFQFPKLNSRLMKPCFFNHQKLLEKIYIYSKACAYVCLYTYVYRYINIYIYNLPVTQFMKNWAWFFPCENLNLKNSFLSWASLHGKACVLYLPAILANYGLTLIHFNSMTIFKRKFILKLTLRE